MTSLTKSICWQTILYWCAQMFSRVLLFVTPWTVARQPLLFMWFSWQEYLSRVPFPPLGDLPDPGIKPESLGSPELAGRFYTNNATVKPTVLMWNIFPFRSFLYKCVNAKIKKWVVQSLPLLISLINSFMISSSESQSVISNSLQPHGLYSPWNSPGQNTGASCHVLLQGIFPTQGLNPGPPHCRSILY